VGSVLKRNVELGLAEAAYGSPLNQIYLSSSLPQNILSVIHLENRHYNIIYDLSNKCQP
jgi:hypothetical protein